MFQSVKPFCDTWGIDSVRKSYRSEDIEAGKSTSLSQLRFAKDLRRRSAILEHQSHPLFFQSLSTHIFDVNSRARRKIHVRQWFQSIVDCIKNGSIQGYYSVEAISLKLRMRNTLVNSKRVTLLTKEMTSQLPRPPTTGFDSDEEGVLYWRKELDSQGNIIEKEIIMPLPFPVPKSLYMPRTYTIPPQIEIIMGVSQDIIDSKFPIKVVTYGYFGIKDFQNHNQCVGEPIIVGRSNYLKRLIPTFHLRFMGLILWTELFAFQSRDQSHLFHRVSGVYLLQSWTTLNALWSMLLTIEGSRLL